MGGTWSCVTVQMIQKGRPAREWRLHGITLTDPTGNLLTAPHVYRGAKEGEWHFVGGGSLAPHETVWKARAEYTRIAGFSPADLWVVKGVPLPGRGAIARSSATTALNGASLQLLGISGPGAAWSDDPTSAVSSKPSPYQAGAGPSDRWTVHVLAAMPGKEQWWGNGLWLSLVGATDERGRRAVAVGGTIEGDGRHHFELKVPPGAKRLDLTFAMPKSRYAEFIASPSRLTGQANSDSPLDTGLAPL
jgi:hypothetical protein